MQFAHPEMLWGLGLLSVPLAIHLFAFRRFKTVYFSNVAWLREIREEQSSVRNLRKWLLLLLRMLAITALVLAFARPELEKASSSAAAGMREMAIVIDNSPSMQSMAGPLSRFELARQQAIALIKQRSSGYSFRLFSSDRQLGGATAFDPASAIAALESLKPGNGSSLLSEIQPAQTQPSLSEIYYFSDFQRSGGLPAADSSRRMVLVQTGSQKTANVSIDSAWMAEPVVSPGRPQTLLVKSRNHQEEETEVRLSIRQGQAAKQEKILLLKAGEIRTDTLSISFAASGWQELELSVDDPAASYDNVFRLAVPVSSNPGLFAPASMQAGPAAKALLASALLKPSAVLPEKGGVVLARSSDADWSSLLHASDNGCNVILFCDPASAPAVWPERIPISASVAEKTALSCNSADWKQAFFSDVLRRVSDELEMPVIERHLRLSINDPARAEVVLRLENGDPLLIRLRMPGSDFWVFSTGLSAEDGGLSRHVLFAPLMFKLAFSGPSSAQIAAGKVIPVANAGTANDETPYRLRGQGGEWIPRILLRGKQTVVSLEELSLAPGFYSLSGPQDSVRVAVNVAASESEQEYYDEEALRKAGELLQIEDMSRADILSAEASVAYWKYLLVFAILMLLAETAVIRLMPA
jgi:hypothetical protein